MILTILWLTFSKKEHYQIKHTSPKMAEYVSKYIVRYLLLNKHT